jgi:hypothetical protein
MRVLIVTIAITVGLVFSAANAFAHKAAHPAPAATQDDAAPKICLFSIDGHTIAPSAREQAAGQDAVDRNSGSLVKGGQKSAREQSDIAPLHSTGSTATGAPPIDQPPAKGERVCGVDGSPTSSTPLG